MIGEAYRLIMGQRNYIYIGPVHIGADFISTELCLFILLTKKEKKCKILLTIPM